MAEYNPRGVMLRSVWLPLTTVIALLCKHIKATTVDPCSLSGYVYCDDGSSCFDADLERCDGLIHCGDNSDEVGCDIETWIERNVWNLIIILPVTLIAVGAVIAGLCACVHLKRKRDRELALKEGEEGQNLQGMTDSDRNEKMLDKPDGFTLARDGNSLWAGHPEYFYTD